MTRTSLVAAAAFLASVPALAQTPAGSEFRVNTTTAGYQQWPSIAALDAGFVVTWTSNQGTSDYDVFGQVMDARGARVGAEFHANTFGTGRQWFLDVDRAPGGRFVVSWEGVSDGFYAGVGARVYEADGTPLTPELQANTYTTSTQGWPSIASDAAGNFVVVWDSFQQDGSDWGVFGQRFDARGARRGAEFHVSTATAGVQFAHYIGAVGMDDVGRFIVVWDGDGHVHGQRFAADGSRMGSEFQIDLSTGGHGQPAVDAAPGGEFVVTWAGSTPPGVLARRYAADGAPVGNELQVSTSSLVNFYRPRVSLDDVGNAVVTWSANSQFPPTKAFLRRFLADGTPRGGEVELSVAPESFGPNVAADPVGNVFATWSTEFPDIDIWARRFGGLVPRPLTVDTAGNGVWEPGETVDVRPSWRNDNGAALTFGGTFSAVTGPAGATYATTDGTGDYGTVPDASSAACTDCYAVSVSVPPARPATHWDASVTEAITPDDLGQMQLWRLHLGDSFSDVPRASSFYRFVETLLHHGVTGGCGAATYCPLAATSRAEMAVFTVVAKEGALFSPPACGTPLFNDVPASSPFCRWIEELARRGVVSGCGGGNYCPGAAVTREEMAVFALRTLDPALAPPACTTPMFGDVPASGPFCRWIEELARRGVVTGCGGGNYCPAAAVTREEMGVFISATFGLSLYAP